MSKSILWYKRHRIAVWLFALLLTLYLLTLGGRLFISDGLAMYLTTRAIIHEGTIAVEDAPDIPQLVTGWDGRTYSIYGLGQPILTIPFYLLGSAMAALMPRSIERLLTEFTVSLFPQFVTAASGLILYQICMKLYRERDAALTIGLLWGTASLAWPYARVYFSESLLTLLLLLVCFWLVTYEQRLQYRSLMLAGITLGMAVTVRVSALIYLLPAALYLLAISIGNNRDYRQSLLRFSQKFAWLVAGLLPLLGVVSWHNYARFHSVFETGYVDQTFTTPLYVGLYGLLFSSGRSVFLYSPLVILGLASLPDFSRRFTAVAVFSLSLAVTATLFYSKWWAWHGGWSWGPRFLVPSIPFLLLPVGARLHSPRFRKVVLAGWIMSLLVVIPGVLVDFNQYIIDTIQGSYENENLLWFIPRFSPLVGHWRYLLAGKAITLAGHRLSELGLPRILNRIYLPVISLLFLVSLARLATLRARAGNSAPDNNAA